MFHFELIHVPAIHFQGPDALSQRGLAEGEIVEDDDDTWLDRIALLVQNRPESIFNLRQNQQKQDITVCLP
jgi:hypothetical protein